MKNKFSCILLPISFGYLLKEAYLSVSYFTTYKTRSYAFWHKRYGLTKTDHFFFFFLTSLLILDWQDCPQLALIRPVLELFKMNFSIQWYLLIIFIVSSLILFFANSEVIKHFSLSIKSAWQLPLAMQLLIWDFEILDISFKWFSSFNK